MTPKVPKDVGHMSTSARQLRRLYEVDANPVRCAPNDMAVLLDASWLYKQHKIVGYSHGAFDLKASAGPSVLISFFIHRAYPGKAL
jgi:hypothetical protein